MCGGGGWGRSSVCVGVYKKKLMFDSFIGRDLVEGE